MEAPTQPVHVCSVQGSDYMLRDTLFMSCRSTVELCIDMLNEFTTSYII